MLPEGTRFLVEAAMGCRWQRWVPLAMAVMFALFVVAVFLGRAQPPARRIPIHPSDVFFNSQLIGLEAQGSWQLDPATGRVERAPLPEGDVLDCASSSPWRDERGRWQVVGLVRSRSGSGFGTFLTALTLTRYEFPGGVVLDRVEMEGRLPAGAPCWEPGTSARLLFAAFDGKLYRLDFDGADATAPARDGGNRQPEPLSWAVPQPGLGSVRITDLSWPVDRRLDRRLLVALRVVERDGGLPRHSSWQLWWLRLSQDGTAVTAAGQLLQPDPTLPAEWEWGDRFPTLLAGPGGTLALAYLAYRPGIHRGQLRIAPLRIDPATGDPSAEAGGPILAGDCLRAAPAASADGRWVCCVVRPEGSGPRLVRLDVSEVRWRSPLDETSDGSGAPGRGNRR